MSMIEVGDLLYEYTVKITGITEYGVSLSALLSGEAVPPPQGARFDGAFEGPVTGPKLTGTLRGVDYLTLRADGFFQLHIHAEMAPASGEKIAFFADGVATPREGNPVADLRENVSLSTACEAYAWVNALQIWAIGTLDLAEQVVHIKGYAA